MAMERTSYGDLVLSLSPPADACWFATAFLFNARIQQCDLLCRPYFGKILDVQVGGGDEHTLALSVDSGSLRVVYYSCVVVRRPITGINPIDSDGP